MDILKTSEPMEIIQTMDKLRYDIIFFCIHLTGHVLGNKETAFQPLQLKKSIVGVT